MGRSGLVCVWQLSNIFNTKFIFCIWLLSGGMFCCCSFLRSEMSPRHLHLFHPSFNNVPDKAFWLEISWKAAWCIVLICISIMTLNMQAFVHELTIVSLIGWHRSWTVSVDPVEALQLFYPLFSLSLFYFHSLGGDQLILYLSSVALVGPFPIWSHGKTQDQMLYITEQSYCMLHQKVVSSF